MDLKYEVIIFWSNEDECFISEMPELPGFISDGKTYEEAIKNIGQVAKMWIETAIELGRDIPAPKGKLFYA